MTAVAHRFGLDLRFCVVAIIGTIAAALLLGIPTAVIPNPFFGRMTPTEPVNLVVLIASAPLMGFLAATYLAKPANRDADVHEASGGGRMTAGGIAAFLAIGCPICNKVVVAALGVSGALNVFAPLQPLIGAASVALLAATLIWRLRARSRGCDRCVMLTPGAGRQAGTPASLH